LMASWCHRADVSYSGWSDYLVTALQSSTHPEIGIRLAIEICMEEFGEESNIVKLHPVPIASSVIPPRN